MGGSSRESAKDRVDFDSHLPFDLVAVQLPGTAAWASSYVDLGQF